MKLINAILLAVALLGLTGTTAHPGPTTEPGVATRSKAHLAEVNARLLAKFEGTGLLATRDDCSECDDSPCCSDCCSPPPPGSGWLSPRYDCSLCLGCCGYCC